MTVERDLRLALAAHSEAITDEASKRFRDLVMMDRTTPEDTRALKLGFRLGPVTRRGNTVETTFYSAARNLGFDYPEFINKVARVVPTKKKYLRWYGRSGGPVFSKGFDNRHKGWWNKTVTKKRWADSVRYEALTNPRFTRR